jgi:hypothetical protein
MPVIMTWKLFKEEKPKHEQVILFLKVRSGYGYYGDKPLEVAVEYQWEELDEFGEYTGCSACYTEGDKQEIGEHLVILVDGWKISDTDLWMSLEDYSTFLKNNSHQLKSQDYYE